MDSREFTLVEVAGKPFDMGYQYGAQARQMIANCMEMFRRTITEDPWELLPASAEKMTFGQIVDLAVLSLPYTEKIAPDLVEELRGVAHGSGFTLEEIFALNSDADVWITLYGASKVSQAACACSTYAVDKTATMNGHTYAGWNADTMDWFADSSVILKGKPEGGLPFLCWNYAGVIGRPGMNPYLGMTANGLWPNDCAPGIPYPLVCRLILQQKTVADGVAALTRVDRMSGMNYMFCDSQGAIADIEATSRHHAALEPERGAVVHSNHVVSEELLPYDALRQEGLDGKELLANSTMRRGRLHELLIERGAGKVDIDDLKAVHRDHANRPESICRHSQPEKDDAMTLLSMICQPNDGAMLIAFGPPCEHEFVEYSL